MDWKLRITTNHVSPLASPERGGCWLATCSYQACAPWTSLGGRQGPEVPGKTLGTEVEKSWAGSRSPTLPVWLGWGWVDGEELGRHHGGPIGSSPTCVLSAPSSGYSSQKGKKDLRPPGRQMGLTQGWASFPPQSQILVSKVTSALLVHRWKIWCTSLEGCWRSCDIKEKG